MPSNYESFDVSVRKADGTTEYLASQTVKIYDVTNSASLGTVTTNSEGVVVAGTLSVAAGTTVRFRIENYQGMAMFIEQVTT